MKRIVLSVAALTGLSVAVGLGLGMISARSPAMPAPAAEAHPVQEEEPPSAKTAAPAADRVPESTPDKHFNTDPKPEPKPEASPKYYSPAPSNPVAKLILNQPVDTLLSSQTSFEKKQAVWTQLKEAGKLDDTINELEQRAAGDPRSAETAAMLGEAYLKKCATTEDIRERAILAMKADEVLDSALNLDPNNWDAQFDKVSAMAKWPAELNKGKEVVDQFQTLIQQQEAEPPQPQFALAYVRFGDFYQRNGQNDIASQIWQRGAAFFPDNSELQKRLTPSK